MTGNFGRDHIFEKLTFTDNLKFKLDLNHFSDQL